MMYGYKKGYTLNALWGFRYGGVWHNQEEVERNKITKAYASASGNTFKPGYARYQDINHDGALNSDDPGLPRIGRPGPLRRYPEHVQHP